MLSLIKSPSGILDVLSKIDKVIAAKGYSVVRDKLGSDSVSAYMIDSKKYDRGSFFKYYSLAKSGLAMTGNKDQSCLALINSSVEETTYEEKRRKMTWGKEKHIF